MDAFTKFINRHKWPVVCLALMVVLALVWLATTNWVYSVRNQGEAYQERIETLHKMSQNSLSTCIDQGAVAAQVTAQEYDTLKDLLTSVASARYVDENGNPTNASQVLGGGQFVSALQESYPEVDQRSWQNLQTLVVACRSEFQSAQDRLFIDAKDFETWIQRDNVFNHWIKDDFPTDDLDAVDLASGATLTGSAALEYMTRVIAVEEANQAFETGTLEQQDLFGND